MSGRWRPEPDEPGYREWVLSLTRDRAVLEHEMRTAQALGVIDAVVLDDSGVVYVAHLGTVIAELAFEGAASSREVAGWTLAFVLPDGDVELMDMPWMPHAHPLLAILVPTFGELLRSSGPNAALAGTAALRRQARAESEARALAWAKLETARRVASCQLWDAPMPQVLL